MAISREYTDYLAELFEPLGAVEVKRMFGGVGVFYRGLIFCLVFDGDLHFKVDASNLADFEAVASAPFSYATKNGRRSLKSFYKVPEEILENEAECLIWARKAVDVALAAERQKLEKKAQANKRRQARAKKS